MIEKLLAEEYGFEAIEVKNLVGYANKNYLIRTNKGKYIFKTYPYELETLEQLGWVLLFHELPSFLQAIQYAHYWIVLFNVGLGLLQGLSAFIVHAEQMLTTKIRLRKQPFKKLSYDQSVHLR